MEDRETKGMEDVVARLKAAAELEANADYQAGFRAGQQWARVSAPPKQLRRVAEYVEDEDHGALSWWETNSPLWNAPFGATDYFVFAVWPDRKDDRGAGEEFWELALGDDAHRVEAPDFFRGFGEGAADVWGKVKGRV